MNQPTMSAEILRALGGKDLLKSLGAEIPPSDRDGRVLVRWPQKHARNGYNWCYIVVEDRSYYSIRLGLGEEVLIEEFEVSLQTACQIFARSMKITSSPCM